MFAGSSVRRRVVAVLLAAVTASAMTGCSAISSLTSGGTETVEYSEAVAVLKTISTSSSFSGSITPVTEVDVTPDLSGVKVTELYVSEGDEVKEGDVLMILDDTSLQQQIEQMEMSINSTEAKNSLSLEQAQQNLDNYLQDLEDGLNSTMMSAESQLESAYQQLVSAIENYNNEASLNNLELSTTMLSAQRSVDTAYQQLQAAYTSISQYEETWEQTLADYADAGVTVSDAEQLSHDQQIENLETSLAQAQVSYDNAVTDYQLALVNENNTLTNYYYNLISAEISYLDAIDNYNIALRTVQRQITSYQQSLESAELSADMTSTYYELDLLYDQLEDCTVTASMDGVITSLSVSEGSYVSGQTAVAVISSFEEFMVEISINEYDITTVEEGDAVTVLVDAIEKEYEGYISSVSRVASVSSGVSYFTAEVKFEGDDDSRSGMSCEVTLTTSEAEDCVAIRSEAIYTSTDGSSYVLMYGEDGGTEDLVQQIITTGVTDGTFTEVTSGLEEGDVVLYSASAASASSATDADDSSLLDSMSGGGFDMGGGGGGGDMGGGGGGGMPGGM